MILQVEVAERTVDQKNGKKFVGSHLLLMTVQPPLTSKRARHRHFFLINIPFLGYVNASGEENSSFTFKLPLTGGPGYRGFLQPDMQKRCL